MSETLSFNDPLFLSRFGLSRANAIDYFLLPVNPFRTQANTSNEVLHMQGTTIYLLMHQGMFPQQQQQQNFHVPQMLTPQAAEDEYNKALAKLTGEQYELLPPTDPAAYTQPSDLYTIRHVLRTTPTSVKLLGIYYIVQGVIYKSPAVRSLEKANVARTLGCLAGATDSLAKCARYQPSVGYQWVFDSNKELEPYELLQLAKKRKRRKILDHRRPGERTAAEEEGIRATEALDQILVRLTKSKWVKGDSSKGPTKAAAITTSHA